MVSLKTAIEMTGGEQMERMTRSQRAEKAIAKVKYEYTESYISMFSSEVRKFQKRYPDMLFEAVGPVAPTGETLYCIRLK